MLGKDSLDSSHRQMLNVFVFLSAVYLVALTVFNVFSLPKEAASWIPFHIANGAIGIVLLGVIWWLNQIRWTRLALLAYLLLVAGGMPLFAAFQSLNRVFVLYAFATYAANFVFAPWASFLFAPLAVAAYTIFYFISRPLGNYDFPAMVGLLVLACAAWLTTLVVENARKRMRASLEKQQAILEHLPIGVYEADQQWRILDANLTFCQMLGYPSKDSLLSVSIAATYIDQRLRQEWHARIEREGSGSTEAQWRRYDGSKIWVRENTRVVRDATGKIARYEGNVEDITARKRSDEQSHRQAEVMAILYETIHDVGGHQHVPDLLQTLISRAVKLVGATYGSIYLRATNTQDWEWRVSLDSSALRPTAALPSDADVVDQVAQTHQPISLGNHTPLPLLPNGNNRPSVGAIAAVPMLNAQGLAGVLVVNDTDSLRQFSDQDVELLSQFAKHVVDATDSARRFEQIQGYADDLALLNQASQIVRDHQDTLEILQTACNALQKLAQFTFAFLAEPDSSLKHVHTTMSAALLTEYQTAVREEKPTFEIPADLVWAAMKQHASTPVICDPSFLPRVAAALASQSSALSGWLLKQANDTTTWLLPLTSAEKMLGILVVVGQPRDSLHISVFPLFARTISAAMETLRLAGINSRSTTELGMLRRTASAWRTTPSLDQVASSLLDEALAALDAKHGALILYQSEQHDSASIVTRGWFNNLGNLASPGDKSMVGRVIATGQPYISKEFARDSLHLASPPARVPSGWGGVCVPIPGNQTTRGLVCIAVQRPRQIRSEEIRLIHTVAEFAGMASVSRQLDTQTKQRSLQLQLFRDTNKVIDASIDFQSVANPLIEQIIKHLQVDAADVLILNPKTQLLEFMAGRGFRTHALERAHLRLGEGFAGKVARQRSTVQIDDLAKDPNRFARTVLASSEGFVSYLGVPLLANGQIKGIVEIFKRAPLKLDPAWQDFLNGIMTRLAVAVEDTWFIRDIQQQHSQLAAAYDQILSAWAQQLELRGHEPPGHTQRVTEMTLRLANQMKLKGDVMTGIHRGALLHDIGKIIIPDAILLSPNPLSKEEWIVVRQHPQTAHDILAPITHLQDAIDIPYCHHERWDGLGYPRGLRAEQIPLGARIFAIVDVWDALTSDRPYRPAWDEDRTRTYIRSLAGTALDPQVVEAFLQMLEERYPASTPTSVPTPAYSRA